MQFVDVVINARCLVVKKRIFFPTVPQPGNDFVEFHGSFITQCVIDVIVETEIAAFVFDLRRHEVPADPAVADVIHRRKAAGNVVGFIERRGGGGHEADMRRDRG